MAEPPSGTVTLLFSDIEGSTRLLQRTGDAYAGLLAEHRGLLREAFARHDGFELDSEGDAFFVAFEAANDAAAAAAEAQLALARHDWPDGNELRVRMGRRADGGLSADSGADRHPHGANRLPGTGFSDLRQHAELDPGHRDHLDETLDAMPLTDPQESVLVASATTTALLAARPLEEILES
jgi:hypothetical protein